MDGGDLFDGIVEAPEGRLTEQFAATVVERSCSALAYLHKRGIAHRDIKPENIMLQKNLDIDGELIKLADFGFARLYDNEARTPPAAAAPLPPRPDPRPAASPAQKALSR